MWVRARVAWSLGRAPCEGFAAILEALAGDADPAVRTAALDALRERSRDLPEDVRRRAAASGFAHERKRVRVSAAPTKPAGVTRIELAELNGGQTLTLWPRAASAFTISAGTPASTIVSSGSH